MKQIPLSRGLIALVDDEDYDCLMQWKWHAHKMYAARNHSHLTSRRGLVLMHRAILNVRKCTSVDHKDGNGLNNQKTNLRKCTHAQNMRNTKVRTDNVSEHKGVMWDRNRNKWRAYIILNGAQILFRAIQ